MTTPSAQALTMTEALAAMAGGTLTARALADAQLARVAATEDAIGAWQTLDPAHVLAAADACDAATKSLPLRGIGVGVKDIIATADLPTTMGSPIFADHRPSGRCHVHRAPARGRRVRVRQDGDHAVRLHGPGQDAQSVGPGAHARRLVVRLRGGGRRRPRDCGDRHADQRLGDPARRLLRRRRIQADAGCDSVRGHQRVQRDVRHGRHVHAHGGRRGAARRRAGRSRPHCRRRSRRSRAGRGSRTSATFRGRSSIATPMRSSRRPSRTLRTRTEVVPVDIPAPWHDANVVMRTIMLYEAAQAISPLQARERARLSPALNAGARRRPRRSAPTATRRRMARRSEAIAFFTEWLAALRRGAGAVGARARARRPRHDRRSVVLHAVVAARLSGHQPAGRARRADADGPAARGAAALRRFAAGRGRVVRGAAVVSRTRVTPYLRRRANLHEARQAPRAAAAAEAAQPGRALAAARQGRTARQDQRPRSAAQANIDSRSCNVTRIPTSDPTTLCRSDLESGRMRDALSRRDRRRRRPCAERRAAVGFADGHAHGAAEGRRMVGVRVRLAAVESAVPVRRGAARDAARAASALLPALAGVARHARARPAWCSDSIAAARAPASRTGCPRPSRSTNCTCCGAARWSSARIARAGSACGPASAAGRADVHGPARASAVRRQAVARRAGADHRDGAQGAFGSSLDYLERTRVALVTHGIIDPYLEALAAKVVALRAG